MENLENCSKHATAIDGNSPEQLADKFTNTSYFFQQRFYKKINENYLKDSQADKERISLKDPTKKRTQLSSYLENASTISYLMTKCLDKICQICKPYMKNPSED